MKSLRDEAGFTFVELAVVIVIIGVLAAIAIPQFFSYRERGYRSAIQSDLATAALQLQIEATDNDGQYPLALPADFVSSPDVSIALGVAASTSRICLQGDHAGLADSIYYDSQAGGITTTAC